MTEPCLRIDFESRSACNLRKAGAWRYSRDPSTEILCLAYRLPSWVVGRVELWNPAFPHLGMEESTNWDALAELLDWIESGGLIEAHSAMFERCIWGNILAPRFGWPRVGIEQWRCSAAQAAALALPRALGDAGAALGLNILKDDTGHKVMMKVSKPRKSRKKEREIWAKTGETPPALLWHESRELFEQLFAYCKQDILSEEALSTAIPPLSADETAVYTMDQTINARGFQIDREAVECALGLIAKETRALNKELSTLTDGKVKKATQRAQMLKWFEGEGLNLGNTQKETIDAYLHPECRHEMTDAARRGLEIVRTLGRSSTAKYQAMQNWMDPHDGRVRGGLLYHGATTGRWSGSGVQPHNFVRGGIKDVDALWDALKNGDTRIVNELCLAAKLDPSVMAALSYALRGAIVGAPGRSLYVADFVGIEARVLPWLADDEDTLDMFRNGADLYVNLASEIYGFPVNKHDHPVERQVGKFGILGLGFGMGASKFQDTLEKAGILVTEEFAKSVVDTYRAKFWRIKQFWGDVEAAAICAVQSRRTTRCGCVSWSLDTPFLFCTLPAGRRLAYPYPEVKQRETPWGEMKAALTFKGVDAYTRKWKRQHTYGGSLVENITQAVARDCLAAAMLRCEAGGYPVVLSIHDEILSESATGNMDEFAALMAEVPDWADGLPIAVEGFSATRYRK